MSIGDFDIVCILGDFNYSGMDWNGIWSSVRENVFTVLFQMVWKPTRRMEGRQPNILHILLANNENLVSYIEHLYQFGKGDNEILYFNLYVHA